MISPSPSPLKTSLYSTLYNEVQSPTQTQKIFKHKPSSFTPERILLSSPQINSLAYQKESKSSRSKMIQAACSSPGVVTLFLQNKLFVKGKDSNSKFITKTLPLTSMNKTKERSSIPSKPKPQIKYSLLTQAYRKAINKVHKINNGSLHSQTHKTLEARKGLYLALTSIEKQCEVSRSNKETKELPKKKKKIKAWTNRMQWTASNLQKWSEYTEPIIKELFDYEVYAEDEKKTDAEKISKDILNKTSREIREQAKFIKKILIKKKEKIL